MPNADLVYAIDFGTTNSLLGAANPITGERFAPIPLDPAAPDPTILRSVFFFPSRARVFYGADAIREYVDSDRQGRLIRSVKKHLPQRSFIGTFVEDRPMHLEDLIGVFLGEMRRRANRHFDAEVDRVLLGRPARFSMDPADDLHAQNRLERAARIAGFREIRFLEEPLAAAWGMEREPGERIALVADFGGGTSDFCVIHLRGREGGEVLSLGGVPVAGDAFDAELMRGRVSRHFGAEVEYRVPFGSNILTMPRALMESLCSPADVALLRKRDVIDFFHRVRDWSVGKEDRARIQALFTLIEDNLGFAIFEAIEAAKVALSSADETQLHYRYPGIEIDERVRRAELETLIREKTDAIQACLDETLRASGVPADRIDLVFATGGTARTPALRRALEARFGTGKISERNYFHSIIDGLVARAAFE